MKKILKKTILSILLFSSLGIISSSFGQSFAQSSHSEADSTLISAVIIMTSDNQGNPMVNPEKTTIKQGDEILVLNNLTKTQTFTNGNGTGDPMDAKVFTVDISPNSFAEYLASTAGNYSFYSKNDPNLNGELIILP